MNWVFYILVKPKKNKAKIRRRIYHYYCYHGLNTPRCYRDGYLGIDKHTKSWSMREGVSIRYLPVSNAKWMLRLQYAGSILQLSVEIRNISSQITKFLTKIHEGGIDTLVKEKVFKSKRQESEITQLPTHCISFQS